jgi:hypothetical protein
MVRVPPPGIASRALIERLKEGIFKLFASQMPTAGSFGQPRVDQDVPGIVWRRRLCMFSMTWFTEIGAMLIR